ncbi:MULTISPECIES: hypothetical protein [unclassified Chryseobacterium]|uniref:hypothetical protein n=1 Tax=unclassified Chryseobacterium TaxID=2593645 RepID=UPI0006464B3F|nr:MULTISPECIES: hypothetical protein [unclassified Chryseobacterium]SHF38060.1 hypothetical protein SAMN02787100_1815 [Chryseobacterium sp. OV279]HCA09459.1 hypothetical protein [Chryseobacterium sp.]
MKRLLVIGTAILMNCTATPSQPSSDMQGNAELLVSEAQGGKDEAGFTIIKNEQEFRNAIKGSFGLINLKKEPSVNYPKFPRNKKVVLYHMGLFRSGSHRITSIKNTSVKNNILYVEVPATASGGMEIQVLSNPWFIFAVPSDYQFTSVELKYSN